MFADVTSLRYWKTERADISTCEDALSVDAQQGLFCVADGAGSTLFSNIWADILVKQYQQNPLFSSDAFEMEWWIRQAQIPYRERAPQSDKLDWNARQKAKDQGAYSTLAALHFTDVKTKSAEAEALAIGDSCMLFGNPQKQQITSFPLQHTQEFDRAPYCVPSLLRNLNRNTLYPRTWRGSFEPGDIVILATDAVARWIISGGGSGNEEDAWKAFLEVSQQTEDDWPGFIDNCRARRSMVDDDSTALIIHLRENGQGSEPLGTPVWPRPEIVAARSAEFEQARKDDNKELLAILYGNGRMLNSSGITLPDKDITQARDVANALREVLQAMRDAVNTLNFAGKVEPVWWRYAGLLMHEPCAETLRKNLVAQGVRLTRPEKTQPVPSPAAPPAAAILPTVPTPQSARKPQGAVLTEPPKPASYQQPIGNDPEQTRNFRPSEIAPALQQKHDAGSLQAFHELLAKGDPYPIYEAYRSSFEKSLTGDELARWQSIQHSVNHLLDVLNEGTAFQKIEAYEALRQPPFEGEDLQQMEMARELVQAMNSDSDDLIADTYRKFEFSPLRKYFIVSPEEQQRIKQAQQRSDATERFRMILQSHAATPSLLLQTYQQIPAPGAALSSDERYIIDLAHRFTKAYQDSQQAIQAKDQARLDYFVRMYYALYYSPYQIACTGDEARQVTAARGYASPFNPPIATVNAAPIHLSHALALLNVRRRYARSRLAHVRQQRSKEPMDQKYYNDLLTYWEQELAQRDWPVTALNELVEWRLLQQRVQQEINVGNARRGNTDLKKDFNKFLEGVAEEMRAYRDPQRENEEIANDFKAGGSEFRASLARLTEQDYRQAQEAMALERLVKRYLLEVSEQAKLADWLDAARAKAVIHYFERPEPESTISPEQQGCWLCKWWVVQERKRTVI